MTQMNLSLKQKMTHRSRLVVAVGKKVSEWYMENLGLADANYYI